jgi:hypothetical protein
VASADVIFSDNLADRASPLWGDEVGSWTTGGYYAQSPSFSPMTYTSLPFNLRDFALDVDITNVQDGGIWLRSHDNLHGVVLMTGGLGGTGTGLYWHIVNASNGFDGLGDLPIHNEVDGLFVPGVSDPHIRIEVRGDHYAAFVNGSSTPATTLLTDTYASGRVALYIARPGQTFHNVVLSELPAVPEPTRMVFIGAGFAAVIGVWARRNIRDGMKFDASTGP